MHHIEALIIDYGNVIFDLDFEKSKNAFQKLGVENVDAFYGHLVQSTLFDQLDKGEINSDQFREELRKTIGMELKDEEIDRAYNSLLVGIPKGRHEILSKLHENYRTFLLSNNNAIHYEYIMKYIQFHYGIESYEDYFEETYFSHFMGMRKPDKEIFIKVIEEQNLNPQTTLFIDDSPQHIATANSLGLQTYLIHADHTIETVSKLLLF